MFDSEKKFHEMSFDASNDLIVKNEPICDNQSISETSETNKKVKEERLDIEMQTTSKSQIESISEEVEVKAEEKFSSTEEFANKASIAFLNEETTTTTTDKSQPNKPKSK